MTKKHARFRMMRCDEKNYRTCPYCGSRMVFIHYEKEPVRLKRYNGAAWEADCDCGGLFQSVKDDRGNWIIYDTEYTNRS